MKIYALLDASILANFVLFVTFVVDAVQARVYDALIKASMAGKGLLNVYMYNGVHD